METIRRIRDARTFSPDSNDAVAQASLLAGGRSGIELNPPGRIRQPKTSAIQQLHVTHIVPAPSGLTH